ncbi:MAG: MerR family transcriptional regulator [Thermodesulfobacteriota bacterium]
MSKDSDSKSSSVEGFGTHQKELNDALALWEALGTELKRLLCEPMPDDFSARGLVDSAQKLLASLVSFAATVEVESKIAFETASEQAPIRQYPITIPEKQYYKIGEISEILDVEPYVLRYWEAEFKILKPTRTRARQRLYHQKDLERMLLIRHLLYTEKFTIAGVKKRLQEIDLDTAKRRKALAASKKALEKETSSRVQGAETSSTFFQQDFAKMLEDIRQLMKEIRERLES